MFLFGNRAKGDAKVNPALADLVRILRSCPALRDDGAESLALFMQIISAKAASFYIYDKKLDRYILKNSCGVPPQRMAISAEYEFVKHLKNLAEPAWRSAFGPQLHNEINQAANVYYQSVTAKVALCLSLDEDVSILLNLDADQSENTNELLFIYAEHLLVAQLLHRLLADNHRLSEYTLIKNQLLSNLTHEIKTPLNAILGFSQILREDESGALNEDHKKQVASIHTAAASLNATLSNLLDLAQIEARQKESRFTNVRLLPLIIEVADLFATPCQRKNISLLLPDQSDDVTAYIDAEKIRTVLMNLLSNAVKFTNKGEIKVTLEKRGHNAVISVSDTGVGIPEDKQHLIFEAFYQADMAKTRAHEGVGLGLALVEKIVRLHRGRVEVKSRLGEGATFVFTLPLMP